MMNRQRSARSERGQILITTAAGLLVLMAIAAIVVDLGMSWMLRRRGSLAPRPGHGRCDLEPA
jgi:Flp pilus assembly protein TadG